MTKAAQKFSRIELTPQEQGERATKLIEIIRARGSDAEDLRDAAHEAHHALDTGLERKWTRDNIHAAIMRKAGPGRRALTELVSFEFDARAVEWIICERFGVLYEPAKWADITFWETVKNMQIQLPTDDTIEKAMRDRKELPVIQGYADRVEALLQSPSFTPKAAKPKRKR